MKTNVLIHNTLPSKKIQEILESSLQLSSDISVIKFIVPPEKKGRSYGGLDPMYVIDLLERTLSKDTEEQNHIFFLTPIPIQFDSRFYNHEIYTIISTYNLEEKTILGFENACALLTYGAFLSRINSCSHSGTERCLFQPLKFDKYLPQNICAHCSNKLNHGGFQYLKRINHVTSRHKSIGHTVLILHGIRTFAPWYGEISSYLRNQGFTVIGVRYGVFNLIKFFLNYFYGRNVENNFYSKYLFAREKEPDSEISVIAHSYGTLVISRALEKFSDISLNKIIFANGVVPSSYNWENLIRQNQVEAVLNDCGDSDIFPVLAKKMIPNAGGCGTLLFETDSKFVINQMHPDTGHSDLLTKSHCENSWINFLLDPNFRTNTSISCTEPNRFVQTLNKIPSSIYYLVLIVLIYLAIHTSLIYFFDQDLNTILVDIYYDLISIFF